MSNNLKFDFDKPLIDLNNSKESENLVVQCQYCETRYSIPSDSVINASSSKFHCFSCDNIFEVTLAKAVPALENPVEQVGFNFNSGVNQSTPPVKSFQASMPDSRSYESTKGPTMPAPTTKASFGFNSSLKVTSDAPLIAVRNKKEETRASEKINFAMTNKSPDLSVRNVKSGEPRKSFVFTEFQKSIANEPVLQAPAIKGSSAWNLDQHLSNLKIPNVSVKDLVSKLALPKVNSKKFTNSLPELSFPKMALPSFSVPRIDSRNFRKLSLGKSGVGASTRILMLLAPIVVVLILLYLLTNIILTSPQSFSGYFGFATQSSRSYPLPGVGVKGLELKLVKLDNGEDLKLLTGEFYNNSSKSIKDPVIEGVLFDTKGQVLARSFHTLDKDISGVQYASLDRKTLTELPNSKEKDKFVLLPNQKQSFAFALSADSEIQPTYFAGRVYSIS